MNEKPELAVRPATEADLPRALEIYAIARAFMRANGNSTQWGDGYPSEELLRGDIERGHMYCILDEDNPTFPCGVFALIDGNDPTYDEIFEGSWKNSTPYATIHRIASDGTHSGLFAAAVRYARTSFDHLRVDTHRDNLPMQRSIEKQGFEYCGIIFIEDGTPRLAYEWVR